LGVEQLPLHEACYYDTVVIDLSNPARKLMPTAKVQSNANFRLQRALQALSE
jgi:hypothetical protein